MPEQTRAAAAWEAFVSAGGRAIVLNVLAFTAGAFALAGQPGWAVGIAVPCLVVSLFFAGVPQALTVDGPGWPVRAAQPFGSYQLSRSLVALSLLALPGAIEPGAVALGTLFMGVVVAEGVLRRVLGVWVPRSWSIPWTTARPGPGFSPAWVVVANTGGLAAAVVIAALAPSPWWGIGLPVLCGLLMALQAAAALIERSAKRAFTSTLTAKLEDYAPRFVLYWEAEPETSYQVGMWLPYLERLGEPFVVILRHHRNLADAARLTSAPIIVCPAMNDLDDVVVPSLTTAFYVNNSIKNAHFVRYPHLRHVQLNHGDSDKAPSFNPVMRMYDVNFVAGPAAVERFAANKIAVRDDFFEIVGRPQVADVQGPREHDGPSTVLYAPTWAGFMADSNYSSLPHGPEIVAALLAAGCTVVFRPHPHTQKSPQLAAARDRVYAMLEADAAATGRQHVLRERAERELSLVECFNMSDALVSDVSSVVPDFLYSGKPFALVAVRATLEQFAADNPISTAAYVIDEKMTNLEEQVRLMLGDDPLAAERERVREHYLGSFPGREYEQVFIDAARAQLQPK